MSAVTSQNPYGGVDNIAYVETEFNGGAAATTANSNGATPAAPVVQLNYFEKMQKYQAQSRSIIGGENPI